MSAQLPLAMLEDFFRIWMDRIIPWGAFLYLPNDIYWFFSKVEESSPIPYNNCLRCPTLYVAVGCSLSPVPLFNLAAAMNPQPVPVNFIIHFCLFFLLRASDGKFNKIYWFLCLRLSSFDVDVIEAVKKSIIVFGSINRTQLINDVRYIPFTESQMWFRA